MSDIEQVRAALEEIGKGIDLIDFSGPAANQNIAAATKVVWPELKRALAALDRMEQSLPDIIEAAERALEISWNNRGRSAAALPIHLQTREALQAILAAVTPLILANERKEIAEQARRYAGHYQEGSDGRNTFIMLAEWIEARK